ncbi:hypothetical protein OE88DRAFT_1667046 [Heliocybe sulcata]|uniref:Uncharacterized protein n=1 Tax=Heliocybe sulcata TaxID=5364 RepID=A0A5C3MPT8_9AGAM|nr:hypothetical protein OE88DRAFT_1667046 [Heliocybe sulcata]
MVECQHSLLALHIIEQTPQPLSLLEAYPPESWCLMKGLARSISEIRRHVGIRRGYTLECRQRASVYVQASRW